MILRLLPNPPSEVYRDGHGDETWRDGVWVAFAVVGVHESDRLHLVAHLPVRLAGVSVAARLLSTAAIPYTAADTVCAWAITSPVPTEYTLRVESSSLRANATFGSVAL